MLAELVTDSGGRGVTAGQLCYFKDSRVYQTLLFAILTPSPFVDNEENEAKPRTHADCNGT